MGAPIRSLALILLVLLCLAGCSYNVIVPDVDVDVPNENPARIPLKAALILPDEGHQMTKTFTVSDFSYIFTIPSGKMIRKSSEKVLPQYFEKVSIVRDRSEAAGFDVILMPNFEDFFWESSITGLSTNHVRAKVSLRTIVSDGKGSPLWDKVTYSTWINRTYTGLSGDEWGRQYGLALMEATAAALKDAARGMAMSRSIKELHPTAGGAEAVSIVPAPEPAVVEKRNPPDLETAKRKLKAAFESGVLTFDQLNRAMDELSSPQRSKTLDAFVHGELDEKAFAELY